MSNDKKPERRPGQKKDWKKDQGSRGGKPRGQFRKDYPRRAPRPPVEGRANLWGTHAVSEAWLNPARQIAALYITDVMLKNFEPTLAQGKELKRPSPKIMDRKDMDRMLGEGVVHQGIAIDAKPLDEVFVQDFIARAANLDHALLLMLDQVTDPHNAGAILRSASAFGAAGVIMQRRHSPELTGVLAKTASGAIEHVPVAYEINLSDTLDYLKNKGFYAIGLDERGETAIGAIKKGGKTVLVLGAEGKGLRPKVAEHCDTLARLPTQGPINSLNVSNAAAVALYALSK